MKILDIRVRWNLGWGNTQEFECLIDGDDKEEFVYETNNEGLWFAEKKGMVRFYAWRGPENEGGYGGRSYQLTMKDGTTQTLLGPWSSRAGCMNAAGFTPCVDISYTDSLKRWKGEKGFHGVTYSGAMTLKVVEEALKKKLPFVEARKEEVYEHDIRYTPAFAGFSPEESKELVGKFDTVEIAYDYIQERASV